VHTTSGSMVSSPESHLIVVEVESHSSDTSLASNSLLICAKRAESDIVGVEGT